MKKTIAVILLLALALTLCACGKKAEAPAPTEAPTPEPTYDPAADIDAAAALFDEGRFEEAVRALSALQTTGSSTVSALLGKAYYLRAGK